MSTGTFPELEPITVRPLFVAIPPATDTAMRLLMLDHLARVRLSLESIQAALESDLDKE